MTGALRAASGISGPLILAVATSRSGSSASSAWESRLRVCLLLHVVVFCVVRIASYIAVARVSVCGFARMCAISVSACCRQALSARHVHEISDAAVQDGCPNATVAALSKLGLH